tara:strand:- start:7793 stop:8506 length:714 start_codon:yes stop_codon:yes gene_type:complete
MTILVLFSVLLLIIIQSILGAGILIFGVPILTIYGFEYLDIVGLLLPSSMTISTLQLFKYPNAITDEFKHLPIAILGVIIGLVISTQLDVISAIPPLIGSLMLLAVVFRTSALTKRNFEHFFQKTPSLFHFFNAILHGFTNLGGVFLTVYSSSVHKSKVPAVSCTALFYLVYAVSQIAIIVIVGQIEIFKPGLVYVPVTALIYMILGEKSFIIVRQERFDKLTTLFFLCAGFIILLQ